MKTLYLIYPGMYDVDTMTDHICTFIDNLISVNSTQISSSIHFLYVGKHEQFNDIVRILDSKYGNEIENLRSYFKLTFEKLEEDNKTIVDFYNTGLKYINDNANIFDKFMFYSKYNRIEDIVNAVEDTTYNMIFPHTQQKTEKTTDVISMDSLHNMLLHVSINQIMFLVNDIKKLDTYVQFIDDNYDTAFIEKIMFNGGKFMFYDRFDVVSDSSFDYDKCLLHYCKYIQKTTGLSEDDMSEVTFVITFKNENDEIFNTVQSLFEHVQKIPNVILIDDCSDDGYNYEKIALFYKNVTYVRHDKQYGVAYSRTEAINRYIKTPYYCLLDGHMRFYNENVDEIIVECSRKHPNTILCSNTVILSKDKNTKTILNENGSVIDDEICGTTINMNSESFSVEWYRSAQKIGKLNGKASYNDLILYKVPCILGACYFGSVAHFKKYLKHLEILSIYGSDEQFLSLMNWLCGFDQILVRNFYVGHIYRNNEYLEKLCDNLGTYQMFNWIKVKSLFNNERIEDIIDQECKKYSSGTKKLVTKIYNSEKANIENCKKFIKENTVRTIEEYKEYTKQFKYSPNDYIIIKSS